MNKKQKAMLARIIVAFIIYILAIISEKSGVLENFSGIWPKLIVFLVPYLIIGWDIIYKAGRGIINGQVFDENFLMTIATFGAFGVKEYSEAVAVMLFYQVGELFQNYAVNRTRQSISDMMDICPEYANIEQDGQLKQVDPDDVAVGDIIIVKAGERIPLDGVVISGESMIDTSALTGESVPRSAREGTQVISGCVNGSGLLKIEVTKEFEDSTVSRILELVENASSKKARVENFITRFARYYTPLVVIAAVLLAVVPPLVLGQGFASWIQRACIFLVISCPCALVISVPLSFFGGIGAASRNGVLVKGSNFLEALAEIDTIVFDKTGTLTKGEFKVTKLYPSGISEEELLELAALAENYSNHPIAASIKDAYANEIDINRLGETEEISGHGVKTVIDGKAVLAGNGKLMEQAGIPYQECKEAGTVIYVAREGVFAGSVLISDTIKEESFEAIRRLKAVGVRKTVMLTGDRKEVGEAVAKEIGLAGVYTELLPGDKVDKVEMLLEPLDEKRKLAFVGDGINDAPVLAGADVGAAMGSGADAAIEAADAVFMNSNVDAIPQSIAIARNTNRIAWQNVIFALVIKIAVMILGLAGHANMWMAVFADTGVAMICVLNSIRILYKK